MRHCLILLILVIPTFAANHYIRAGASGAGTGADWTNACTAFSGSCAVASLVRGDTYYISTGTYAGVTFNKAVNGSLVITIQRATITNHGTDTGWSNAFDAQVTWGEIDVSTSFWTFNGVTFPVDADPADGANTTSNYGFFFNHATNCSTEPDSIIGIAGASNVTFTGIAASGCGGAFDTDQWFFLVNPTSNNLTVSHAMATNFVDIVQMQGSDSISQNSIFEYVYSQNNGGSASHHGEAYQFVCTNCTVRYNWFDDCGSSGVTACISGNAAGTATCGGNIPLCNTKVYGNIFRSANSGNAVMWAAGSTCQQGTNFYNNTIVSSSVPWWGDGNSGNGGCSGNILENNLVWSTNCGITNNGSAVTINNNTGLSCSAGSMPAQTNLQTGSFNPFVNSATKNYHLASNPVSSCASSAATCGGVTLASPYDVDFDGNTRGSTGQWARGAFDIAGGSTPVATPAFSPVAGTYTGTQSVTISTSTGGATLCYTTDGTTPTANGAGTCTHGTTYASAISVLNSETIKAIGSESGFTDSTVSTAAYVINHPATISGAAQFSGSSVVQ